MQLGQTLLLLLQFWLGVLGWIIYGIRRVCHWILFEKRLITHFCHRLVAVENRLRGSRHMVFLYRFWRFAVHRYQLLPSWVKLLQTAILMGLMIGQPLWQKYQHRREVERNYAELQAAQQVVDTGKKEKREAQTQRLAQYYASPVYRQALRTALPATSSKELEKKATHAPLSIREMHLAAVGFDLLRHFEGLRLMPYRDATGKLTLGYGHLLRKGEPLTRISKAKAEELLQRDVGIAELLVKEHVKAPLSLSQFSALVVLVYNIGGYHFKGSTLLQYINQQRYAEAAEEMRRWERAGGMILRGLTKRRYAEYLLFTGKWRRPAEKG